MEIITKSENNNISKAVFKTELTKAIKYITIEKHIFSKESQILNIPEFNKYDFIRFINCTFINIDFNIFEMFANEFIKCKFKDCGDFKDFNNNNYFDNCLWGKF